MVGVGLGVLVSAILKMFSKITQGSVVTREKVRSTRKVMEEKDGDVKTGVKEREWKQGKIVKVGRRYYKAKL